MRLDLSTPELEYEQFLFPLNRVFDWDEWQDGFYDYWHDKGQPEMREVFKNFRTPHCRTSKAIRFR